jgi:hypothetical protein
MKLFASYASGVNKLVRLSLASFFKPVQGL